MPVRRASQPAPKQMRDWAPLMELYNYGGLLEPLDFDSVILHYQAARLGTYERAEKYINAMLDLQEEFGCASATRNGGTSETQTTFTFHNESMTAYGRYEDVCVATIRQPYRSCKLAITLATADLTWKFFTFLRDGHTVCRINEHPVPMSGETIERVQYNHSLMRRVLSLSGYIRTIATDKNYIKYFRQQHPTVDASADFSVSVAAVICPEFRNKFAVKPRTVDLTQRIWENLGRDCKLDADLRNLYTSITVANGISETEGPSMFEIYSAKGWLPAGKWV
jgi:hypothetical protein